MNDSGHDNVYGEHHYPHEHGVTDGRIDCAYGCGCWMSSSRSGGPLGLDPRGICPGNLQSGTPLGQDAAYHYVVEQRINALNRRAHEAEQRLKEVPPDMTTLLERLRVLRGELEQKNDLLRELRRLLQHDPDSST